MESHTGLSLWEPGAEGTVTFLAGQTSPLGTVHSFWGCGMPRAQAAVAFPDLVLCANLGQPHWPAQSLRLRPPQLHAEQDSEFCGSERKVLLTVVTLREGTGCKYDDPSSSVSLEGWCSVHCSPEPMPLVTSVGPAGECGL